MFWLVDGIMFFTKCIFARYHSEVVDPASWHECVLCHVALYQKYFALRSDRLIEILYYK